MFISGKRSITFAIFTRNRPSKEFAIYVAHKASLPSWVIHELLRALLQPALCTVFLEKIWLTCLVKLGLRVSRREWCARIQKQFLWISVGSVSHFCKKQVVVIIRWVNKVTATRVIELRWLEQTLDFLLRNCRILRWYTPSRSLSALSHLSRVWPVRGAAVDWFPFPDSAI